MTGEITQKVLASRFYVSVVGQESPISDVGQIFTWKWKVNDTIPVGAEISLNVEVTTSAQTEAVNGDQTIDIKVVDSASDPDSGEDGDSDVTAPSYTISPVVSDPNPQVGDTFTVSAVVTADQADAGLAAVDAVLNYDETLVKPVSSSATWLTTVRKYCS